MTTVRETVYDILRQHGMTTIFGNPGSNELPFLHDFPKDFRYILGLHEGVVLGMADGYAQASGQASFVNLHATAGTGNAMGALTNASQSHTPIVVTAGQQVRDTVGVEPLLTNPNANLLPLPLVKWAGEPMTPQSAPHTIARAIHHASLHPQGPTYVSIPYDDWSKPTGDFDASLGARRVVSAGRLAQDDLTALADRLSKAANPVIILGPDVDAARAQDSAVLLAEKLAASVWVAPSAPRCPFPTSHHAFRGVLPAGVRAISDLLEGHDLLLVVGAPVFRYHQYDPGAWLPKGASLVAITTDHDEAARAPMGDAFVADVGVTLADLAAGVTTTARPQPQPRAIPPVPADDGGPLDPSALFAIVDELSPPDSIYVNESTSTTAALWQRLRMDLPGSYYFCAAGGLGFGMPAAVGVQLARPDRPVVAMIGDGSAQYAIQALWSAVQYNTPVKYVILKNGTYGALRWFSGVLKTENVPGMDVPGVDFCALAKGYGMTSFAATDAASFREAFAAALRHDGPALVEIETRREA